MRSFEVRDLRKKAFFMVDDIYLNGYAKFLGTTASMIYISLCRHSDKNQKSFPSQKLIAAELGLNERIVMRKIKLLEEWGLIGKEKTKSSTGKWLNNTYFLLDKANWKLPPTQKVYMETTYIKSTEPPTQKVYIKETHKKETHRERQPHTKITYLQDLQDDKYLEDIKIYIKDYNCTIAEVKTEAQKIINWCQSKGKTYKNYKAALSSWLIKDYGSRKFDGYSRL